ncbi:MAG: hypothetical protein J0L92_38100 [Deltaproteobacteria bacterium]|nr:hypothetical protein [Deltaproteobacteria bacterium]
MSLRRIGLVSALLVASGCGGATQGDTRTTPADDPCVEHVRARDEASAALGRCRETVPAWRHEAVYGTARDAVRSLAAISGPVPPADAQRAADAVWELLDAVSPEMTSHVALDRAENAAEALLRDREGDAARAAVTEAELSLTELRAILAPEPADDPCAADAARVEETTAAASSCT